MNFLMVRNYDCIKDEVAEALTGGLERLRASAENVPGRRQQERQHTIIWEGELVNTL